MGNVVIGNDVVPPKVHLTLGIQVAFLEPIPHIFQTEMSTAKPSTNSTNSVVSELDREKEEEVSVAGDPETAEKIEIGEIASDERKHYNSMIQHVQNQGMESKTSFKACTPPVWPGLYITCTIFDHL